MYTAKIGDVFIEMEDNEKCTRWKLICKDKIKALYRFSSSYGYEPGNVQTIRVEALNRWVERGWFVLDKEYKVKKLLTKLDEINLR